MGGRGVGGGGRGTKIIIYFTLTKKTCQESEIVATIHFAFEYLTVQLLNSETRSKARSKFLAKARSKLTKFVNQ